jgi:hypothetical protein
MQRNVDGYLLIHQGDNPNFLCKDDLVSSCASSQRFGAIYRWAGDADFCFLLPCPQEVAKVKLVGPV